MFQIIISTKVILCVKALFCIFLVKVNLTFKMTLEVKVAEVKNVANNYIYKSYIMCASPILHFSGKGQFDLEDDLGGQSGRSKKCCKLF